MHSFYELCNLMGGILAVVRLPNIMNPIFLVSTYCNAIYMIPTKLMMAPMDLVPLPIPFLPQTTSRQRSFKRD